MNYAALLGSALTVLLQELLGVAGLNRVERAIGGLVQTPQPLAPGLALGIGRRLAAAPGVVFLML